MSRRLSSFIFNLFPIRQNRVCFVSYSGQGFGDNPKYIALEMLKHKEFELVWLYDSNNNIDFSEFPKDIKLIKLNSLLGLYYMSTCHVLISNMRLSFWKKGFKKKKQQIYIQTWHGSFSFKKIEADALNLSKGYVKSAKNDSKNIDYLSSGSKWAENALFKGSFWYAGKYFRGGNPRNDVLFKNPKDIKKKIVSKYKLSPGVKIAMYAPTFRKSHDQSVYQIDYAGLKKALQKKFRGEWIIFSRLHPNMIKEKNIIPNYEWLFDVSKYPDMQELLCVSDLLITDYSSSIFDFLITKRPGFIFALDKKRYEAERGFKIPLEGTPFPIAYNNKKLIDNITQFDSKKYLRAVEKFLKDRGVYDKGDASKKLVELIIKVSRSKESTCN
ncbi:MAG: CDP-glycerol glycerophosphotransferase family protein [Alphaproteobacteria bacterium]|nr:CDP-glycerol glycerophosphotransferase family protein [Alphaproteobacteria bacterium]